MNKIQRFHGKALIVLGLLMAMGSVSAQKTGAGPMGFLKENPIGEVGLLQAYLLMALIGFSIVSGCKNTNKPVWSIIGISAHLIPLLVVVMYGSMFKILQVEYLLWFSLTIHSIGIVAEITALSIYFKKS